MEEHILALVELSKQNVSYMNELWSIFEEDCRKWAQTACETEEEAIELYDEAYIILANSVRAYKKEKGQSFSHYYRRALSNKKKYYGKCYQKRRDWELSLFKEEEEGSALCDTLADDTMNIEEKILQKELVDQMMQQLTTLSQEDYYILTAFYRQGESIKCIGEHLGKSRDAINGKKKRALKNLESFFKKSDTF